MDATHSSNLPLSLSSLSLQRSSDCCEQRTEVTLLGESNAKVAQSLCNPMDYPAHGSLQARTLEWVAFPFSRGIFPTQRWNPGLPHCRRTLYQLSHQGSLYYWLAHDRPHLVCFFSYQKLICQLAALLRNSFPLIQNDNDNIDPFRVENWVIRRCR